jgi:ABC-type nitrate/sulfonate/bicarbonate transport system permease component
MKPTQSFTTSLRNEAIGLGLILVAWCVSALFYPAYIIPAPWTVIASAGSSLPADLPRHLFITLYRVLAGFSLSLLMGTLVGFLAYRRQWGGQMTSLMNALQVLPGTVLGVIFLLMFGAGHITPILLIASVVLPTVAINTNNGLSTRDLKLEEYLRSIGSNRTALLSNVYLPALVPVLQSNLSLGMGMATKVVVLGEFIGSQDGLGFLLNTARMFLNMKEVFFYLLILLVFTLVFQAMQSLFFSTFLRKYFLAE